MGRAGLTPACQLASVLSSDCPRGTSKRSAGPSFARQLGMTERTTLRLPSITFHAAHYSSPQPVRIPVRGTGGSPKGWLYASFLQLRCRGAVFSCPLLHYVPPDLALMGRGFI